MSGSELRRRAPLPLALVVVLAGSAPGPLAAQAAGGEGALAELGARMVGTWEADGSRHVHEWGVGRRLIRSRSYASAEGGWTLVAEGMWWWDEEAGAVRGLHFAVGMPMDRMEYRSRVDGDRVVHELRTFGAAEAVFRETWVFEGDAYRWTVEQPAPGGYERLMGGAYRRVSEAGG